MKIRFDSLRNQWKFSPEGGTLSRLLSYTADRKGPIGNYAVFDLGSLIFGWLAGFALELTPALQRSFIWLNDAIKSDEKFGPSQDYHRRNLYKTRAMVRWMLSAETCIDDWRQAEEFDSTDWDFEKPPKMDFGVRLRFEDRLAFLLQAGEYSECQELYTFIRGTRPPILGARADLGDYASAAFLAQQGRYTKAEVNQLGKRLLKKYLESDWLAHGQAVTAAMWLKIILWDSDTKEGCQPILTPLQTILKAYEYMPHVETPEFVQHQYRHGQA